jgi:hypothetical protein
VALVEVVAVVVVVEVVALPSKFVIHQ